VKVPYRPADLEEQLRRIGWHITVTPTAGSGLLGPATAALAIPGVDVVAAGVLIGTTAYFAGEYVYQHWGDITHAVNDVGSWAGNEVDKLASDLNPLSWS
jgi:hypothetical protein